MNEAKSAARGAEARLRAVLRPLARWSRQPVRCAVLLGLLATVVTAALTLSRGWPVPTIHDEFGYLLGADTFAHGRLANPTPAGWEHFETFHVLQQPSYVPKFPPASFATMGFSQALCGRPVVGVWLANGLLAALAFWALRAWLPGRWALLGGLLTALNPLVLRWGQCYWGGTLAALGGTLVLGAYGRLTRAARPGPADSFLLGTGLLVMANSRPFEGLLLGLVTASALLVWFTRALPRLGAGVLLRRCVLPLVLVLLAGGAWMGWYNYRATGHPRIFAYLLHEQTYSEAPLFFWQKPQPPLAYRHKVMADFAAGWAMDEYRELQHPATLLSKTGSKLDVLLKSYSWDYALLLPGLVALWRWRRLRGATYATAIAAFTAVPLLGLTYPLLPHYAAPFLTVTLLLQVQGLRWLRAATPEGSKLVLVLLAGCLAMLLNYCLVTIPVGGIYPARPALWARPAILRSLAQQGGRHLIFVRYADNHDPHDEWVYNGADIPGAPILWARDLGAEKNARLRELYPGRAAWLLEPDRKPPTPVPYP